MRRPIPFKAVSAVLAALALAAAGCGGEESSGGAAEETDAVTIQDFEFLPADATVAAGAEVTFANEDTADHTATSGETPNADGTFDTGVFGEGEEAGVKLDEPGEIPYFCKLHPNMEGTITVE